MSLFLQSPMRLCTSGGGKCGILVAEGCNVSRRAHYTKQPPECWNCCTSWSIGSRSESLWQLYWRTLPTSCETVRHNEEAEDEPFSLDGLKPIMWLHTAVLKPERHCNLVCTIPHLDSGTASFGRSLKRKGYAQRRIEGPAEERDSGRSCVCGGCNLSPAHLGCRDVPYETEFKEGEACKRLRACHALLEDRCVVRRTVASVGEPGARGEPHICGGLTR